jgi:hypothetical protein
MYASSVFPISLPSAPHPSGSYVRLQRLSNQSAISTTPFRLLCTPPASFQSVCHQHHTLQALMYASSVFPISLPSAPRPSGSYVRLQRLSNQSAISTTPFRLLCTPPASFQAVGAVCPMPKVAMAPISAESLPTMSSRRLVIDPKDRRSCSCDAPYQH